MQTTSIAELLSWLERVRFRTRRVALLIPSESVEWTWREGKFTPGDLVRHIAATERWMFAENVASRPSLYPGHDRSLADGKDAVIAYLDRCHEESLAFFRSLSEEDMQGPCTTPGGATLARWKWLRAMIEHEIHHRGQLYLLLSMLGVDTPPLYGLTSEEVRERSGMEASA